MTAPPPAGRTLGRRWELRSAVGDGPGRVEYRALDRDVGVEVDLWWLWPELFADDARQRRLISAAATIRRVVHPSIRKLFAIGREEGHLICAWQIATAPALEPQPFAAVPLEVLGAWIDAVAGGLAELHRQGVVHGRLTPRDVVGISGGYRIGGAGLWTDVEPLAAARAWRDRELYLAPEVRDGDPPSAAADVYSLGAIAAALVAGRASSLAEAMRAVARRHPALHEVLTGLTASASELRPTDLGAIASALRAAADAQSYLADDRSGPLRAVAPSAATTEPRPRPPTPPLLADPSHPAFAPLTPVPTSVAAELASAPGDPLLDPILDAATDPDPGASATVIGHAPGPAGDLRPVAGSIVAAPVVLHAVSMKPPAAPRPARPEPAPREPRMRRISAAMARSFSTAPGSLGYLAPPRTAASSERPPRVARALWWLIGAAVAIGVGASSYFAVRGL